MTNLNLTANGKPQELILAYLQENASGELAEKINKGVFVEKDGKRLLSRKDLDGFMRFASDEAKKLAEKGARSACVEDGVVYGWAIHYFEEDAIEGKLFNPDGTEYKPFVKPIPKPEVKKTEPPKPTTQQASLWDMLKEQAEEKPIVPQSPKFEEPDDDGEPTEKEIQETLRLLAEENGVTLQPDDYDDTPTVEENANKLQQAVDKKNGVKPEPPKKDMPVFYVQYMDMKTNHKEEIVLIRLGDFYEAFDNDAVILAEELDLTLTGRSVGTNVRVPMVGFPYHAADTYINKIRNKYGIVIIESNGDVGTLGKIVKTGGKSVDTNTGEIINDDIEELSEAEMREFDGDIQEPKVAADTDDNEETAAPYSPYSFDKETMIYLYDLLDGKLDIA